MATGAQIRETRIALGMTQVDLAKAVGVDPRTIRDLENDATTYSRFMRKIERALGIPVDPDAPTKQERARIALRDVAIDALRLYEKSKKAMMLIEDMDED